MNRRAVRVALLLVALGALAAGAFVIVDAEQTFRARRAASNALDVEAEVVATDLGRLQSAQQAYVAEGQGSDYWMTQAAESLARVERALAALAADATADATRSAIQAASAELESFRSLDQRARQYVKRGQALMASDVIFTESLAALASANDRVAAARANEKAIAEGTLDLLRWRQFYAACGAGAVLLLALLLLAPIPEREMDVLTAMRALTDAPGPPVARPRADPSLAVAAARNSIQPDAIDEIAMLDSGPAPAAASTPSPRTQADTPAAAPRQTVSDGELATAARVCADMARVLDAGDLPGLLTRSANVLKAPGLIVWVADRGGQLLHPLLTHGFDGGALARIGPVPTAADNATAMAWRTGELQVVDGSAGQPGALAAPIVTAEGCVGVFAAELPGGRESREDVRALAMIFAAQLATFVTALPAAGGSALAAEA
jgi:GAF domain